MATREQLRETGVVLLSDIASLTGCTLIYGISIPLFIFSVSSFLRRDVKSRITYIMFSTTIISFLLATLHWIAHLLFPFYTLRGYSNPRRNFSTNLITFWAALPLQLISDATVTWRAWALLFGRQRWLIACSILLLFGALASGLGFLTLTSQHDGFTAYFSGDRRILGLLYASVALSAAGNITATALIAYRLWMFRTLWSNGHLRSWSYAQRTLLMIIESGALYAVLQLATIVLFRMKTEFGSPIFYVENIIWPTYVQLTAMYPTIVLLLVGQKRSMTDVECFSSASFGPERSLRDADEAGSRNKTIHSDI